MNGITRHCVWCEAGGMDELYGKGNFEDDDYCMKLLMGGYSLIFCNDSFIYHFGHQSFSNLKKDQPVEYNSLLHGRFEYRDEGILDRTHLRFFTKTEIALLMQECGLLIERFKDVSVEINLKDRQYMEQLCSMDATISEVELGIYQYVLRATTGVS